MCVCVCAQSRVILCNPVDCSPPGSCVHGTEDTCPRQEYFTGFPFPTPGDLPNLEIVPIPPASHALAGGFFTTMPPGKLTDLLASSTEASLTCIQLTFPLLRWVKEGQPGTGPPAPPPSPSTGRLLTVTSFPRLTEARTRFMPSPLPICQIRASAAWFFKGQSLACSSYQTVLWRPPPHTA